MRPYHCAGGLIFAKLWSAPEEMLVRRLILTNGASGAGNLKMARIGDLTIGVSMLGGQVGLARYSIAGPLPDEAETADFFGPQRSREAIFWQSIRGPINAEITADWLMGLSEFCRSFDVVECWFDPDADGQLNLVHLLDHVRQDPETAEKTVLVHSDAPVGGMAASAILASNPPRASLDPGHLDVAHRFWTAYRQPTPEAFAELLDADLSALPHLDRLVPCLLAELPSVETGLGVTEMQILERIAGPDRIWNTIFPHSGESNRRSSPTAMPSMRWRGSAAIRDRQSRECCRTRSGSQGGSTGTSSKPIGRAVCRSRRWGGRWSRGGRIMRTMAGSTGGGATPPS